MSNVTVFSTESAAVSFVTKAGVSQTIAVEGALFKGGVAFKALKDAALISAGQKAANGKYRAAADILAAVWPSIAKATDKLLGSPWGKKSTFVTFVDAIVQDKGGKNGPSKKQQELRLFVLALQESFATKSNTPMADVVEMVEAVAA